MHNIERKSAQEEPATTPEQKDIATPVRQKPPRAWRYILIGAAGVLVLALTLAGILSIGNQRAKQPAVRGTIPTSQATTLPTSTPITSQTRAKNLPLPVSKPIPAPAISDQTANITIVGGVAYLSSYSAYNSALNSVAFALRTGNGSMLWQQEIQGSADQAPLVSNGVVYITSYVGQNSPVYIYALRATDGSLLWRYSNNYYSYLSPSTSKSTVVYVASQGGISALNSSTGAILWHFAAKGTGTTSPLEVNGVVYFSSSSDNGPGALYALRATNGSLIWQYKTSNYTTTPLVADGVVYVNSDGGVLAALRVSDGHQLWKQTLDANNIQSPQLVNGVLYLTTTKITLPPSAHTTNPLQGAADIGKLLWGTLQNAPLVKTVPLKEGFSSVYAIRASDGAILWHYAMNHGGDSWSSWFSVVNGVVYASDTVPNNGPGTGDLFALQSSNGSELWHDKLNISPSGALLANGIIYLNSSSDSSGVVYAVRASDGSLVWDYPLAGTLYASPVLDGNTIYTSANNGMAYALRADNGKLLWYHFTKGQG
jgi:outer membrane protein assembly factor BamB